MNTNNITIEELTRFLGEVAYTYADGYKPKDFPLEFGTEDYYKALMSVIDDVTRRAERRYCNE